MLGNRTCNLTSWMDAQGSPEGEMQHLSDADKRGQSGRKSRKSRQQIFWQHFWTSVRRCLCVAVSIPNLFGRRLSFDTALVKTTKRILLRFPGHNWRFYVVRSGESINLPILKWPPVWNTILPIDTAFFYVTQDQRLFTFVFVCDLYDEIDRTSKSKGRRDRFDFL